MNTTSPVTSLSGDELDRITDNNPEILAIAPDMPLYEDLSEILERKSSQELVFYAHEEVWDE